MKFGHMVIEKNGIKCKCGNNGCFEAYASMRVLKDKIKSKKKLESITGKELYEIIENEEDIRDILDEFVQNLCIGLTNLIRIFEPEAICIGGSFAYFEDLLLPKVRENVKENSNKICLSMPEIITAKYENDAGIIGAT
ncbi:MAG: ROK family protein, partial [Clostridia bacterium]|nr:ROK family protein [Clostridia bacterium]